MEDINMKCPKCKEGTMEPTGNKISNGTSDLKADGSYTEPSLDIYKCSKCEYEIDS